MESFDNHVTILYEDVLFYHQADELALKAIEMCVDDFRISRNVKRNRRL